MQSSGSEVSRLLEQVETGPPIALGAEILVPLLLRSPERQPDAELLDEALGSGSARVTEVSEKGSVNRVRVFYSGKRLLLLLAGEQVLGAKQNRVFNASFLVAPGKEVEIPVSCVEQRRWRYETPGFRCSESTLSASLRASSLRRVATSVSTGGDYDPSQATVWREVEEHLQACRVASATASFQDSVVARAIPIDEQLERLRPLPNQIGLARVSEGAPMVVDLFGSVALYARAWKKVARGMLLDVATSGRTPGNAGSRVQSMLGQLSGAPTLRRAAPGCGETIHSSISGVVLGAAVHEGAVYHALVAHG